MRREETGVPGDNPRSQVEIDWNSIHIQHCSRGGRRDWCPLRQPDFPRSTAHQYEANRKIFVEHLLSRLEGPLFLPVTKNSRFWGSSCECPSLVSVNSSQLTLYLRLETEYRDISTLSFSAREWKALAKTICFTDHRSVLILVNESLFHNSYRHLLTTVAIVFCLSFTICFCFWVYLWTTTYHSRSCLLYLPAPSLRSCTCRAIWNKYACFSDKPKWESETTRERTTPFDEWLLVEWVGAWWEVKIHQYSWTTINFSIDSKLFYVTIPAKTLYRIQVDISFLVFDSRRILVNGSSHLKPGKSLQMSSGLKR